MSANPVGLNPGHKK